MSGVVTGGDDRLRRGERREPINGTNLQPSAAEK